MGYWVYLARCSNNTIYTGSTTDLKRREREHNGEYIGRHGAKYTAAHRPVTLVQAWKVDSWSDALRLEYAIKQCSRLEKDRLIEQPEQIHQLAERRKLILSITEAYEELTQTEIPDESLSN